MPGFFDPFGNAGDVLDAPAAPLVTPRSLLPTFIVLLAFGWVIKKFWK